MAREDFSLVGDPRLGRGGARRRLIIAFLLVGAAVLAFVYAMNARGGKEAAADVACPGSRQIAKTLAPLAHGEVAAFAVSTQPGPLPELVFNGPDGAPTALASFRGQTVLLNFWATWCVPCRKEMPALDRLQAKAGSDGFKVVAVNIDTAKLDRPKAFLKEAEIKNLDFFADETAGVFQTLKGVGKALGLPTTILVDRNGCDLGVMAGPAEWDSPDALALIAAARK
ncbi:Redoxin domain protein [Methylocella silvestris BL2]|uniref:Redoxin domain protein n=1 Tax=Methylocella silvestris (strain DSM 15510 / CIP 108128 / LMG 27833 / NCIMB 13906 / BL2) TaxID=395965 RepID=B8EPF1_METSB|nr:TlpA disulfide reductase family protein [Methylocella silvestris]ACK50156.1 Redoxin domain protein [Methylocella silvestris BL2]